MPSGRISPSDFNRGPSGGFTLKGANVAELVTGEAVALDLRVARPASRFLALLLDLLIQFALLYFLSIPVAMTSSIDSALATGLEVVVIALVTAGYPTIFETLSRGRTLGKMALGIRVVSDDGGIIRFRQALVRGLSASVEIWALFGMPTLISSLLNRQGKRIGDIFAGTIVIQDRVPTSAIMGPAAIMPPQLAGWGQALELSGVTDAMALTARQYLLRFWELLPEERDTMGQRITDQVLAKVSPPPPPGVRPEIILSAVLAERRRREEWRLWQRATRRQAMHPQAQQYGGQWPSQPVMSGVPAPQHRSGGWQVPPANRPYPGPPPGMPPGQSRPARPAAPQAYTPFPPSGR
jgi:uncharacterized RDD family membrane protein YckC